MRTDKIIQSQKPVAIVFPARQTNGLGVIRSLGKRGIPVIGLDYLPMSVGYFSRFCTGMCCPAPNENEAGFIKYLVKLGKQLKCKGVLFLMDDHYVFLSTKYREELEDYYYFSFLDFDVMHKCVDKRAMYEDARALDIPVPATFWPETSEGVRAIAVEICYPCIVKPIGKFELNNRSIENLYGFFVKYGKALRITDEDELIRTWKEIDSFGYKVIVQEEIAGGAERLYSLGGYCNEKSEMLAAFTGRKIRQIPPDFGTCTLAEGVLEPELVEYGRKLFKKFGFWGIAELEFKKDTKDGKFKFIEINPRAWTWISLATACGVDLPYMAYIDLIGSEVPQFKQTDSNIKWIDLLKDIIYFLKYHNGSNYAKKLSLSQWLRSVKGPKTYIYFNKEDPMPGFLIPLQLLSTSLTRIKTSF